MKKGVDVEYIKQYIGMQKQIMKNYDKNIESSYLMHLNANNFYGWAMSQNLPVNGFKWKKKKKKIYKFDEDFIKNYDEDSNKRHILEVDIEYPKNL